MMEAGSSSETKVTISNTQQDVRIQSQLGVNLHRCENVKSQLIIEFINASTALVIRDFYPL